MSVVQSYRDLIVWQKAMELSTTVYSLLKIFPQDETYGIIAQMKRAAVSIASNIAEGRKRGSRKDYRQFLIVACGSCAELETQIELSRRLGFCTAQQCTVIDDLLTQVTKMLNAMIASLSYKLIANS